ncbi:MAG: AAA family ATPase [Chloroflexi bacterium]|nr:AAA family ATPase [Chloroflexota bacterium]
MRFVKVIAESFGPFRNGELLLSPGFTLIYGPNESGKSTWHSAIYYALCSVPAKNLPKAEKELIDRYRPWGLATWEVSALISLADGRHIRLSRNPVKKTSMIIDEGTGKSYSSEIDEDGVPNGAQWLGLDRKAFRAVAWVRQAEILEVLENAAKLKEYLEKVIASPGEQASVTTAIERVKKYRKDKVGNKSHGNGQWLQAQTRLEKAREELEKAREAEKELRNLESQEEELQRKIQAAQMVLYARECHDLEERLREAEALASQFPAGEPVEPDQTLVQPIIVALAKWENRPLVPDLSGESSAQLRARIAALPPEPAGDLSVSSDVREAYESWRVRKSQYAAHAASEPAVDAAVAAGNATSAELRHAAATLEQPRPVPPASSVRFPLWFAASCAALVLAIIAFLTHLFIPALLLAAASLIGLLFTLSRWLPLRDQHVVFQAQLTAYEQQRAQVEQWLRERSLPADPSRLRNLAGALDAHEQWASQYQQLKDQLDSAGESLRQLLQGRGTVPNGNLEAVYLQYERKCEERRNQAERARQRSNLEERLRERERLEQHAAQARQKRREASEDLQRLARQLALSGEDDEALAPQLRAWLREKECAGEVYDTCMRDWYCLQVLLNDTTLDELRRQAQAAADRCQEMCTAIGALLEDALTPFQGQDIATLADNIGHLKGELSHLQGRIAECEKSLPSLDEAEQEVEKSESEVKRLEQLDKTLELTEEFLSSAAAEVFSAVAGHLNPFVSGRLPLVTRCRYHQVRIDPEDLTVTVTLTGSATAKAAHLSHGTAEQIYLLLRVAMAQYLTKPGEICPLILDDVTVHCDAERKRALLDLLHELSRERQIILFSQEDAVLNWAEQQLTADTDRDGIIYLQRVPLPD